MTQVKQEMILTQQTLEVAIEAVELVSEELNTPPHKAVEEICDEVHNELYTLLCNHFDLEA